MASHTISVLDGLGPGAVDAAFWSHELPSDSNLSPVVQSDTPPSQTPRSDSIQSTQNGSQNGHNGQSGRASTNGQQPQPPRTSVAVACQACRNRHLKCDGGIRCSRCKADGVECTYVKSRRGWKGKKKPKVGENGSPNGSVPGQLNGNGNIMQSPINHGVPVGTIHLHSPEYSYPPEYISPSSRLSTANGLSPTAGNIQYNLDGTRLARTDASTPHDALSAFYHYFWNAHPFCLPRPRLMELLKDRKAPLLEFAVQYIGSCYVPALPTELYEQALERSIQSHSYPKDGYSLQALLMFSIGLHANNRVPRSAEIFHLAVALMQDIGVHRLDFASLNGPNDMVLQESWRRTWWSMYCVNGMLAAVNPHVQFTLYDFQSSMVIPLPCDDARYLSGHIPYPHTLQDYDEDTFSGAEATIFSAFTYLIDAIRILGRVFELERLGSNFAYSHNVVDVIDTHLTNWRHNLPTCKLDIVSPSGVVDEVLFQAHMVNSGATIKLHRPRSSLSMGAVEKVNVCVQPGQTLLPTQSYAIHSSRCRVAAENIDSLIKLPANLVNHTPFFTCVCVMSSVVHLSDWSFNIPDGQDDDIKQSIRLDVGTLQQYSNTWPIAKVVLGQVRGVAHTLFEGKRWRTIHSWDYVAQDEVIRNIIEEGAMVPLDQYRHLVAPMLRPEMKQASLETF